MSSHIYLLSHHNGRRFKIGKANDIIERAKSFGLAEIDWSSSAGYLVESVEVALRLERVRLRLFDAWRLKPAEVLEDGGATDGASEWMWSACRPRVEELLQHVSDIVSHTRICGSTLDRQVDGLLAPVRQAIAERALRAEQRHQRSAAREELQRVEALKSQAILEEELVRAQGALWRELERHYNNGSIVGMSASRYGWSLVLLQEGSDENVWQADSSETRFRWPRGAGNLFDSVWEFGDREGRVSLIGLSCLARAWPSRTSMTKCLGTLLRFLRSLEEIECDQLQTIAWAPIYDEGNEALRRYEQRVLDAFLDEQLPKLQGRRAARLSGSLFDLEVIAV